MVCHQHCPHFSERIEAISQGHFFLLIPLDLFLITSDLQIYPTFLSVNLRERDVPSLSQG